MVVRPGCQPWKLAVVARGVHAPADLAHAAARGEVGARQTAPLDGGEGGDAVGGAAEQDVERLEPAVGRDQAVEGG
ncbi:MAG: hypothetical protein U0232_21415 [Thermomicrobiales bacterium]